jgi:phosphoglycolate phosphatase
MSVKAVIFDLDGTLLYTLEDLTDSVNFALSKFNYPQRTIDEIRLFVGNGVRRLIERAIPEGESNPHFDEVFEIFKSDYSSRMFTKTRPYDEIIDVLKKLKEYGYKLAVVSNKYDSAVKELCEKYFKDLIDISVGQTDTIPPKPSAESVFKVVKELNLDVSECVYIGDSEVDIQTAHNAGMDCISVTWGYKDIDFLYSNGASMIVYSPSDILDIL